MKLRRDNFVIGFLLGLLLGGLIGHGVARGESFTPQAEGNYRAALAAWGIDSPPDCSSVDRELVAAIPDALGEATIPDGEGPPEPCELLLVSGLESCLEFGVLVHEVGHLLGHHHSSDPAGIMYDGDDPAGQDNSEWWCDATREYEEFQPFAERKRAAIDRWVRRCSRFHRPKRRRECWDYPRTWRHDLRREWGMVAADVGPRPTLP